MVEKISNNDKHLDPPDEIDHYPDCAFDAAEGGVCTCEALWDAEKLVEEERQWDARENDRVLNDLYEKRAKHED